MKKMNKNEKSKFRHTFFSPGVYYKGKQERTYHNSTTEGDISFYKKLTADERSAVTVSKNVKGRWKKLFTIKYGKLLKNKRRK